MEKLSHSRNQLRKITCKTEFFYNYSLSPAILFTSRQHYHDDFHLQGVSLEDYLLVRARERLFQSNFGFTPDTRNFLFQSNFGVYGLLRIVGPSKFLFVNLAIR
jgi:hypothetical protein